MKIHTIGFTKKSAETFFGLLRESGATRVVDVRLNVSQLAGFAKKDDLAYFLKALCRMKYSYRPDLAPTQKCWTPIGKSTRNGNATSINSWPLCTEAGREAGHKTDAYQRLPLNVVRTHPTIATAASLQNVSDGNGTMLRLSISADLGIQVYRSLSEAIVFLFVPGIVASP